MQRKLFLLGGSAAFEIAAAEFSSASGGRDANVALLLQGGPNWQKYVAEYVRPWAEHGATRYAVIVPDDHGKLNLSDLTATLSKSTGIFIGGGHTAAYRLLYATEPVRSVIRTRYSEGIPIAGCSAGALIAPEICAFHPGEGDEGKLVADGLGLISGFVVGVHFSGENVLSNLLAAMAASHTLSAWGIDDSACVMFEENRFKCVLGHSAYEINMTDFATKTYSIKKRSLSDA